MGAYKHIKRTFANEYKERAPNYSERMLKWRAEPPITRAERPTNIARARELGYKAKEGILVARVKLRGGTSKRPTAGGGRKPSKTARFFSRAKSLQAIAEERAARRFSNSEVLNSYFVGQFGSDSFYEVILLEKGNPSIMADPFYGRIASQRGRANRGMTSQGKKHRGIV